MNDILCCDWWMGFTHFRAFFRRWLGETSFFSLAMHGFLHVFHVIMR
jgi:hypothetical protein